MEIEFPTREERVAMVRTLVGDADPAVKRLTVGLRAHTHRHYDRWVVPLIREHWPALQSDPFGLKLRLAACDLYGSAPYTVLLCAPRRPPFFRLISGVANLLPLPLAALAVGGQGAMWVLSRLPQYEATHRRIILIAAFIAAVDHAFDHCMQDPPKERGRKVRALIAGEWQPDTPPLRLARALRDEMGANLADHEREPFAEAMRTLGAWVDSEVRSLLGTDDASGLGHRLAGIEGTIDGLLVAVRHLTSDEARAWMVDVSLFVQMLDDWIDLDDDLADGLRTPVAQGSWKYADIALAWNRTVSGIEDLVIQGGLTAPHYVRFMREAYVLMLREVVEGMADRRAD